MVQVEEVHPGTGDDSPLRSSLACKSAGYTAEWQRKAYFTFLTGYILVVPTIVMVYCYASIIRVIWLRTCRSPAESDTNLDRPRIHFVSAHKAGVAMSAAPEWRAHTHQHHTSALRRAISFQPYQRRRPPDTSAPSTVSRFPLSSKRTVVKMTMLVVAGFVLCWTPYFVVSLIRIYSDYEIELNEVLSISEIMALGHSAVNPLLYMIYSRRAVRMFFWQVRRRVRCPACHCAARRAISCPSPPPQCTYFIRHAGSQPGTGEPGLCIPALGGSYPAEEERYNHWSLMQNCAADRTISCPSPPPQPPLPLSAVHATGNGRSERGRTRRKWFVASGGGGDDVIGGHIGGARSAPCHVTCSWSSSSRREASAATDCRPYRRQPRLLTDDKLVLVTPNLR